MNTPWGEADSITKHAEGIIEVSTPGHGGIGISGEAAKQLSAQAKAIAIHSGDTWWFEEDCDWAVAVAEFPEVFSDRNKEFAIESLARWNPDYKHQLTLA